MKKFFVALVLALALTIGVVGGSASAHSTTPAWRCHTQIDVLLAAISTHNRANIGAAAAALAACEGAPSVAPVAPVTPFGFGFPSSNFGFGQFGFGNGFGFGSGTNFGFGLGDGNLCPAGSGLVQGAALPAATYMCVFGATGFGVSAICGGQYHLIETIVAPEPYYQCVL